MRFTPKYDKGKSVKFGRKRGKVAELQSRIVTESKRVRVADEGGRASEMPNFGSPIRAIA